MFSIPVNISMVASKDYTIIVCSSSLGTKRVKVNGVFQSSIENKKKVVQALEKAPTIKSVGPWIKKLLTE